MDAKTAAQWMQGELEKHECLYQNDVVDFLVKSTAESLLRENSDGNLVLGRSVLNEFRNINRDNVVWVRPEKYWRFRVPEDEEGRDARG
ncbi:hypothetical protein [Salinicola sp. CR57]|uniref:DUF6953 family protein n=1 Tax=Salinicola sp. CR57 TaxID=1949086 RepID=UPI000DA21D38|nr:hypothetical protein [Salinicola sp. CR57]